MQVKNKTFYLSCIFIGIFLSILYRSFFNHTDSGQKHIVSRKMVSVPTPIEKDMALQTYASSVYTIHYPRSWFVYVFPSDHIPQSQSCMLLSDIPNPQDIPNKIPSLHHQMIQICSHGETMPTIFPYTNGSVKNNTITPLSLNGYTGIRGNDAATIGLDLEDIVFLKNPKGGYVSLIKSQADLAIFSSLLSSFRFK